MTLDQVIRSILGIVGVAILGWLVWFFSDLVFYVAVGFLLAYFFNPLVDALQGLGVRRIPAILVVFLGIAAAVGVLLAFLVPFIVEQVVELSDLISLQEVKEFADSLEEYIERFIPFLQEGSVVDVFTDTFLTLFQQERFTNTLQSVTSLFTNLVYAFIIVPFATFFFLKDRWLIRESMLQLVPNRYFEITLSILDKIETNIRRYFRGLFFQCLSVATTLGFLLWLAGLDNAIGVGIVAGVANTIPYFGPLIGLVAALLVGVAQTGNFVLVPAIVGAVALTQLADAVIFQPFIFSRASRLHPLIILLVVLVGARIGGVIGMLLAIPVTTVLRVTVEQVLWSVRNYRVFQTSSM